MLKASWFYVAIGALKGQLLLEKTPIGLFLLADFLHFWQSLHEVPGRQWSLAAANVASIAARSLSLVADQVSYYGDPRAAR